MSQIRIENVKLMKKKTQHKAVLRWKSMILNVYVRK